MSIIKEGGKIEYPQPFGTMSDNNEQKVKRAYSLFHVLWGDSKDKVYSKQLWGDLQSLLSEVICVKPFRIHPDHKTADQIRVSKLESENTALKLEVEKMRDALSKIKKIYDDGELSYSQAYYRMEDIAEQALKS